MTKKFFLLLLVNVIILTNIFFILSNPVNAAKSAKEQYNSSLNNTAEKSGYPVSTQKDTKYLLIHTGNVIAKYFLGGVGLIFLILLIYAGYSWMISRGNEQDVEKAKSMLQNAVIGLIIILAAWAITATVNTLLVSNVVGTGSN